MLILQLLFAFVALFALFLGLTYLTSLISAAARGVGYDTFWDFMSLVLLSAFFFLMGSVGLVFSVPEILKFVN